jgi:hypothetical protein
MNLTKIEAGLPIAAPTGLANEPHEDIARAACSNELALAHAGVETVLAFVLSDARGQAVWRDALLASYAPTFFDAFVRARERFEGVAASLARSHAKSGGPPAAALRYDLALWEAALVNREPQERPRASSATDGRARNGTPGVP